MRQLFGSVFLSRTSDYTGRGTGGGAWVFVDAKGWVDSTSVSFHRVTAVNNFAGAITTNSLRKAGTAGKAG